MNHFQKKIFTSRWIFEEKIHWKSRHYKWINGPNFSRWVTMMHVAQVLVWRSQGTFHVISCVIFMRWCCVCLIHRDSSPLFAVHFLSYRIVHLPSLQLLLPRCWWTNSESIPGNEDFGTFAEYDPLTGYEPNDYHISFTIEPYIQESSGENGVPEFACLWVRWLYHRHGVLFTTVQEREDPGSPETYIRWVWISNLKGPGKSTSRLR